MKTLRVLSLSIVLFISAISLSGQYQTPVNSRPASSDSQSFVTSQECDAAFSVILDSLTAQPYLYHFKDLSTGIFNKWSWDFGDGTTSQEQHPSHQFAEPGTYTVCLTIEDQNNISNCSDQACQDVVTMKYYSLGGQVYAGEHPLNNPVNEGDTGLASLYRIVNNQITFVEDQTFYEYGYYWFGYLFPGQYIIKISLTENSTHFADYFTTYFGDEISWSKADMISITDLDEFAADIHLESVKSLATGTGIIKGYVKFEQGNLYNMPPVSQTSVILADEDHNPLIYSHPDGSGYFEFNGVPFETYYLSADATGKPSSTIIVTISQNVPLVEGINLTVFGSNVNFIPDETRKGMILLRIYPNPIQNNLNISLYSEVSGPAGILLNDVNGKVFYSATKVLESGLNEFTIPAFNLPKGAFLLLIKPQGSYQPVTAKFIK